jgi:hypothetical protein
MDFGLSDAPSAAMPSIGINCFVPSSLRFISVMFVVGVRMDKFTILHRINHSPMIASRSFKECIEIQKEFDANGENTVIVELEKARQMWIERNEI